MLAISTLPSRAAEPSVLGLWQKKDEANRTVGWFLFVEHKGTYEGAIASCFRIHKMGPSRRSAQDARMIAEMLRFLACL